MALMLTTFALLVYFYRNTITLQGGKLDLDKVYLVQSQNM